MQYGSNCFYLSIICRSNRIFHPIAYAYCCGIYWTFSGFVLNELPLPWSTTCKCWLCTLHVLPDSSVFYMQLCRFWPVPGLDGFSGHIELRLLSVALHRSLHCATRIIILVLFTLEYDGFRWHIKAPNFALTKLYLTKYVLLFFEYKNKIMRAETKFPFFFVNGNLLPNVAFFWQKKGSFLRFLAPKSHLSKTILYFFKNIVVCRRLFWKNIFLSKNKNIISFLCFSFFYFSKLP